MFFIFGWGRATNSDLGPTLPIVCPNCRNDTVWHLHEHKKWFTLFFLPIFPYESNHLFLCPICSRGIELAGERLDHALRLNSEAKSHVAGAISDTEFKALLGATPSAALRASDPTPVARCPGCGFNAHNGNVAVCPQCHSALQPLQPA